MVCIRCFEEIVTLKGAAYEITAFQESGSGDVIWKERTGKVMCKDCVQDRKYRKPDESQMTLA